MLSNAVRTKFTVGDWLVDPASDHIASHGESIKLDARNMQVLVYLAQHPNEVVSLEDLQDHVWGRAIVAPGAMYQAIALLRRALGDSKEMPRYIKTIPRKGYQLIAPVAPFPAPALPVAADSRPVSAPPVEPAVAHMPTRWERWRRTITAGAAAAVILAAGALWARNFGPSEAPVRPSLVVLPFKAITESPAAKEIGEGLSQELSSKLGRIPSLRVVRWSPHLPADLRQISKELDVTHVLEGSVQRSSSGTRIFVRLVEVKTLDQVWSRDFDQATTDFIRMQDQVARQVAALWKISASKASGQRQSRDHVKPHVYDTYLAAKAYSAKRLPKFGERAVEAYQHVIKDEPELAEPYVGLAEIYVNRIRAGRTDVDAVEIERLLDKALQLDDALPEVFLVRGTLRNEQERFEDASSDLTRAIELNPSLADAYQRLGQVLGDRGRLAQAVQQLAQAVELDPYDAHKRGLYCVALAGVGQPAEARSECDRALALEPKSFWALHASAIIAEESGHPERALDWYRKMAEISLNDPNPLFYQASAYMDLQLHEQATQAYDDALVRAADPKSVHVSRGELLIGTRKAQRVQDAQDATDLVIGELEPTPNNLLRGASLCLLAKNTACAVELAGRAQHDPGYSVDPSSVWTLRRLGDSRGLPVALLAHLRSDTATRDQILTALGSRLDYLEREGARWHNLYYLRARVAALQDRRGDAISSLRQAVERGWHRSWYARLDPCLSSLRGNADFQTLLSEVDARNRQLASRFIQPLASR